MDNDVSLISFLGDINTLLTQGRNRHKEKKLRGETFNVFTLLGVSSSEVRLHSAILGELFNPKGSHGAGSRFLKEFLLLNIPQWNKFTETQLDSATVDLEVSIGER